MLLLKKHILLLVLLISGCFNLYTQDSTLVGTSINWDLAKCIDYAKKNNIQINSLRLLQQTSQQEYLLAKAARLPDLSGIILHKKLHALTLLKPCDTSKASVKTTLTINHLS